MELVNVLSVHILYMCSSTTSCLLIPLLTIFILWTILFFFSLSLVTHDIFFSFPIVFDHVPFSVDDLHHYCPISNYSVISCFIGYTRRIRRKSCHVILYFIAAHWVWVSVCAYVSERYSNSMKCTHTQTPLRNAQIYTRTIEWITMKIINVINKS